MEIKPSKLYLFDVIFTKEEKSNQECDENRSLRVKMEILQYFSGVTPAGDSDPLVVWRERAGTYRVLASLAVEYL